MIRSEQKTDKDIWLTSQSFIFEEAGDTLAVHKHSWDYARHLTVVTSGAFIVHGDQEGRVLQAGDTTSWKRDELHGFEALHADSRLVNIRISLIGEIDPEFRMGSGPVPLPPWLRLDGV